MDRIPLIWRKNSPFTIKILRIILSIVKEGDKTIYRNIKKKKKLNNLQKDDANERRKFRVEFVNNWSKSGQTV